MNKSVVVVKKNFFTYNEEDYDYDSIIEMKHLLKSNLKLIILEEDLYVKQFTNKIKRNKVYEFIQYKINNEFPQNGDILYNFDKNNNSISIYYIKGAKRIEKLSEIANDIEVKPIQIIVKDVMKKVLKSDDFNCKVLINMNGYYYYMLFKGGLFNYGFVKEIKEEVMCLLIETNDFGEIYVDNNIVDNLFSEDKFKLIKINLGELINEKIYEKQKFYSRKVLQ